MSELSFLFSVLVEDTFQLKIFPINIERKQILNVNSPENDGNSDEV